ncbi:type IX secretion system membrane protein PorP/SprF [uncultured Polaribacter sp.]|uniref:PorP/SprF family type IX secretion system membrane protein n=1 Tax=uncultured Polaribacter sp. TaxID=174711 RepID=UPI0026076ABD|nr:type IX secretion system membrane protein PorP/SprF [uncultured Polaribacter sp.]
MKSIIKNTALTVILLVAFKSLAQKDPLYTQYYNNFNLINPAYAGSQGSFIATANIRSQWSGEVGSPKTQSVSFHSPVGYGLGVGMSVINDNVFVLDETHLYADISYVVKLSEMYTLAFGIKAGGSFLNVDLLSLGIENDVLFSRNINTFNPNIGTGMYLSSNRFYASLSTLNLLETKHYNKKNNIVSSASDEMVFYFSSGYLFDLNENFKIRPSFMLRTLEGVPVSTDISANILWLDKLEFGLSHRINTSVSVLFQLRLTESIKVGYTYDTSTFSHSNFNNGSHEFSFIFNIKKTQNKF